MAVQGIERRGHDNEPSTFFSRECRNGRFKIIGRGTKRYARHLDAKPRRHGRHLEAERLGDGEIDDELEFGRLLDWKVARLRAAEDLVDIVRCAAKQVRNTRPV